MTERKDYPYQSALAEYMTGLIAEKRKLGFIYNTTSYTLKRFDTYWLAHGNGKTIQREPLEEWLGRLPGESKSSHLHRVSTVKQLSIYMNTLGVLCYVPVLSIGTDHNTVHVLGKKELEELFEQIDNYIPASINHADYRMAKEYPVMFRLYYCCGMRNNEVCSLETADVDLKNGIITIRDGKNRKDRLVYLSEDLRILLAKYLAYITRELGHFPLYLFPGRSPDMPMAKGNLDKRFNAFWKATESSCSCDKKPTLHCLRHTFVVNRLNQWILDGVDLNVMFAYLSRYLGHKSPEETFYYYHLVSDAFRIIRQKDSLAGTVIPEVRRR